MKKFFILIALAGVCIPAVQGLPTEVAEKYEIVSCRNRCEMLKEFIQSADAELFKTKYTFPLPPKLLRELEQTVIETRKVTRFELTAMGTGNKDFYTIAKGVGLSGALGSSLGHAHVAGYFRHHDLAPFMLIIAGFVAYKVIVYAGNILETGWNYRQYLQNKLENLDAIAAHIAYEKNCIYTVPVEVTVEAKAAPVVAVRYGK